MDSKFPTSPIQYGSHWPQEAPRPLNMACEAEERICAFHLVLRNLIAAQGWRFQQEQQSTRASWFWAGWGERTLSDQGVPGRGAQDRRAGPQSPRRGLVFPCDIKVRTAVSSASWGRQDHLIFLKAGAGLGETPKQGTELLRFRATGGVGAKVAPNSRWFYSGRETWKVFPHSVHGRAGEQEAL